MGTIAAARSAQNIADALTDAAHIVRHDLTAVGAAISCLETALTDLRKLEDATLAELHGHTGR